MAVRSAPANLLTVGQSSAQVSDGSLKFQGPLKTLLSRTFSTGNRRTYTISFWAKSSDHDEHGSVGTGGGQVFSAGTVGAGARATFGFSGPTNGANADCFQLGHNASGSSWASLNSVSKFRDFSAWQHFVVKVDVTQTFASDRVKFYVNNVEQLLTGTYPSDEDQPVNNNVGHAIGRYNPEGTDYFDGLLSNFYFIDGQALGPSYFGYTDPLTNTWRPKKCLDGDQGAPNTELLYNVNTSDNGFDSTNTVREYATAGLTFSTYTTPQTADPGGYGANSAHVYKSPTGSAITWLVSTDTTDRYIWISFDGKTWSSKGSTYDTDGSTQSVYAVYIALAGGSNASNVTVTSATVTFGTNGFYLPLDGNLPIGRDQSGKGNDWEPVNFGGSTIIPKATGALPILNTVGGGKGATVGVRTDAFWDSCVLALPLAGGSGIDYSNHINSGSTAKTVTVTSATSSTTLYEFYGSSMNFDGSNDKLDVADSTDFDVSTGDWCAECWFYTPASDGTSQRIFANYAGDAAQFNLGINSLQLFAYLGSTQVIFASTTTAIHAGEWVHLALTHVDSSNTTTLYINGVSKATSTTALSGSEDGFYLGHSTAHGTRWITANYQDVRFYKGTAKYTGNFSPAATNPDILLDTPSGASLSSELTKVTDGSVYFDGTGDYLTSPSSSDFAFGTGDFTYEAFIYVEGFSAAESPLIEFTDNKTNFNIVASDQKLTFWDGATTTSNNFAWTYNKWTHIAFVKSGTNIKFYSDGKEWGSGTSSYDSGSSARTFNVAANGAGSANYLNGFISNLRIVKGTAVYTSDFTPPSAPLTDITNTKLLCCQSNTSAIAYEVSPGTIIANGDAVATTPNPFNTDINTVIGRPSNFVTLNPLDTNLGTAINNGNLNTGTAGTGAWELVKSTIGVSSGRWYWEGKSEGGTTSPSSGYHFGVMLTSLSTSDGPYQTGCYSSQYTYVYEGSTDTTIANGTQKNIAWALDLDENTLKFYIEGVLQHTYTSVPAGEYTPFGGSYGSSLSVTFNFGQKPFAHPSPEGYKPLSVANLPNPAFVRPDSVVGVATYAGNGSAVSVTGYNFSPDLIWIKGYTDPDRHGLYDTLRGVQERLQASEPDNEDTVNGVMSFNSNGFSVGDYADTNGTGRGYVAWCWKAGGSSNTFNVDDVGYASAAAAGLDDGTVTPTGVSVGTKQGFSIIKWTREGATDTISHGLSEAPTFIIQKSTSADDPWQVGGPFVGSGWDRRMYLNTTDNEEDSTSFGWTGNFGPTSTVIRTGGTSYVDGDMIAYCWHDVPGLQKFGTYEGNNSTNNTYVELGFEPAIIIFKNIDSDANWMIYDNVRDKSNEAYKCLYPNLQNDENDTATDNMIDILSTGFKVRNDQDQSGNAETYMYAAWAYQPINNLYGAQSNAR